MMLTIIGVLDMILMATLSNQNLLDFFEIGKITFTGMFYFYYVHGC